MNVKTSMQDIPELLYFLGVGEPSSITLMFLTFRVRRRIATRSNRAQIPYRSLCPSYLRELEKPSLEP